MRGFDNSGGPSCQLFNGIVFAAIRKNGSNPLSNSSKGKIDFFRGDAEWWEKDDGIEHWPREEAEFAGGEADFFAYSMRLWVSRTIGLVELYARDHAALARLPDFGVIVG